MLEQTPNDPPATAGRSVSEDPGPPEITPPRFGDKSAKQLHESVARFRLLWALLVVFLGIFGVDVWGSSRFWKDLHDVADTLAPFVTLFAGAIGSAITFYFSDRERR